MAGIELLVVGTGVAVVSWLLFRMNRITSQDHTSYQGQRANVAAIVATKPKSRARKIATKKAPETKQSTGKASSARGGVTRPK